MDKIQISLRAARVNAGLTIHDAAKKIGISHGTLAKWEKNSGVVNPIAQAKISETYNLPIDIIFFG